jgi:hypothetical protein
MTLENFENKSERQEPTSEEMLGFLDSISEQIPLTPRDEELLEEIRHIIIVDSASISYPFIDPDPNEVKKILDSIEQGLKENKKQKRKR